MRPSWFLVMAFSLLAAAGAGAQVPTNPIGLNPPSLEWQTIHTDRVEVIFPREMEAQAQRLARVAHYMWDNSTRTLGDSMIPVSIMLHNQPVVSNGFVTVGPFRSEFYASPPQFNMLSDWIDILAIHEYRHVMQFGNSRKGITRLAKTGLGSWVWGGMVGMALPRWFFEGDAVVMETALTGSGRGRLPAFTMEYRAWLADGVRYGYEKAAAGSLFDYVPDWYTLGYYLTTYARQRFGAEVWRGVVDDAVRYRPLFFPFSQSLKARTGLGTPELYEQTFNWIDSLYRPDPDRPPAPGTRLSPRSSPTVVDYNLPLDLGDGRVVAHKRGYDQISTFVAIDSAGQETKLTCPGVLFAPLNAALSHADHTLAWAEMGFDLRWGNRNYSIIRTYDLATGQKRQVTARTRLFSPALDRRAERIAAVQLDQDMAMRLVILDAETGQVLDQLPNPEGWFLAFPQWLPDGSGLVAVAQHRERAWLIAVDISSGTLLNLTTPTDEHLSHPFVHEDHVYYSRAHAGTNNIFALRLDDGQVAQLTDVYTGAFQPSVSADGEDLLYSLFTGQGYEIRRLRLDEALWLPIEDQPAWTDPLARQLAAQEGGRITDALPPGDFAVEPFRELRNLVLPHSLLPTVFHPTYGLEVLSDNVFGTLSASAGVFYNANERQVSLNAGARYAGWFPVLEANYRLANRSALLVNFSPLNDSTLVQTTYNERWIEHLAGGGVSVPLTFSRGNAVTRLQVGAALRYLNVRPQRGIDQPGLARDTFVVGNVNAVSDIIRPPTERGSAAALDLRADFRSFRRLARQHLNPRWGVRVATRWRQTLGSPGLQGTQWLSNIDLFLPGLHRNHSAFLNVAYLEEDLLDNYKFSNILFYPRGYGPQAQDRFVKVGLNYRLPLAYPDWALGPVAFVKRVKATAFFDWGRGYLDFPFDGSNDIRSAGVELTVDFRLFRLLEVDAGLRYSYAFDPQATRNGRPHQFDFILISISE